MIEPAIPVDEKERIAELHGLQILDTPAEERFDRITRVAKHIFNVPIVLVSLVDANRQWFKSCIGLSATETPRGVSFCAHAILVEDLFHIPDSHLDDRFRDNPLVTGEPFVRFYAGMPLRGPQGRKLGTLCIIDHEPRQLTEKEKDIIRDLAKLVERELGMSTTEKVTEQYHQTLERLALATESAGIGVWDWDVVKNELAWDDRMYALYGITKEDFTGAYEAWQQGLHPDDVLRGDDEIRKALTGEKEFDTHFRVVWPDTSIHHIRAYARVTRNTANEPVRMTGVNWDITAEFLAAERLEFLASVVASSDDAIYTKTMTGVITSWNRGAERMYGFTEQEAVGKNISIIVPFEKNDVLHIIETMKRGELLEHYVTTRKKKDGTHVEVMLTASPVRDKEGDIIGISVIAHDYSREKQIQQMKSDFVSMVSHQLKTPMAQVMGFVDNMLDGLTGPLTEKQKEYLSDIRQVSADNAMLIDDLLNVSRLDRGILDVQIEKHDIRSIVSDALKPLAEFAKERGVVLSHQSPEAGSYDADADRQKAIEVIRNIVHNAIKFTKTGTEVAVAVSETPEGATVSVTDHGEGIKKEAEPLIFSREKVMSGRVQASGAGLGLYLAKQFMEKMGGDITYKTAYGAGTTFIVTFKK